MTSDDPRAWSAHDLLVQQLLAESNVMDGAGSPEIDELERLRPASFARCTISGCGAMIYMGPFDEDAAVEGAAAHERVAHQGRAAFLVAIETRLRDGRDVTVHRERATLGEWLAQEDPA